jgi:hypothetical protein
MEQVIPISLVAPRRRFGTALVAVLALLVSCVAAGVAGAGPLQAPEASDAQAEPFRAFLEVPGVDLEALGYAGEPIDAAVLDRIGADLPDDDYERIVELTHRIELAEPALEALVEAESVLERALARMDPDVGALRTNLAVAEQVEAEGQRRVEDARTRLAGRMELLAGHRRQMAEIAVAAYVNPPDADVIASVLGGAATTSEDLTAGVLFTAKTEHDGVVREDLELAAAIAAERLTRAAADVVAAGERIAATHEALTSAEARRDAHRLAHTLVAGEVDRVEEAIPSMKEHMDELIYEALTAINALIVGDGPDATIVSVDGIRVHSAIAPNLLALLMEARAEGVPLGGWGHRTIEQQIMLRQAHCGPTPEDIYLKPAVECSPPTARPGASMHERGLAVDFHLGGASISTRQSPGYQWLAANAARFGFYNLPSEPWHWSVNGQ